MPYIDTLFILKPGSAPRDYQLKPYPMDPGRCCLDAVLSPDGNSVISCETSVKALENTEVPQTRDLELYDISAGTKTALYSSDTPFGSAGTLNGRHESIYITGNGKLLDWFNDGYRLYQLK